MSDKVRILIADHHTILREGLRSLLSTEPNIEVVGEAANGKDVVSLFQQLRPDVTLLGLLLAEKDGISVIREIKEIDSNARILVLSGYSGDEQVLSAITAGALGYVLKTSSFSILLQAIQDVYNGNSYLDAVVARKVIRFINQPAEPKPSTLSITEREMEVICLIVEGLSNDEIAERLTISERTVSNHIGHILSKLHLNNRTHVVLYAIRTGICKPEQAGKGLHFIS